MQTHLDVQDEFADALLSAATPVPSSSKGAAIRRADRRFAVYRNNVAVSLVEALGARFPVVKRLVGDEFFSAMAHTFVLREPPLSPLLIYYGETFPAFIGAFDAAKPLPYLADVAARICAGARLSRCRCRAAAARCLRRDAGRAYRLGPRHAAPFGRHYRFALSSAVDLGGQSGSSCEASASLGGRGCGRGAALPRGRDAASSPRYRRVPSRFRRARPSPRRCSVRPWRLPTSMPPMVSRCSSARISPSLSTKAS